MKKILQRRFHESTRDVLTIVQGPCLQPVFWEGHWGHSALLHEEQGNNTGQLQTPLRGHGTLMGGTWNFWPCSSKETKTSFRSALLKLSFCEIRVSQRGWEIRNQIYIGPKGISMICSVPFPGVLVCSSEAKPSSLSSFNASALYVFYCFLFSSIIPWGPALYQKLSCALRPAIGWQPTIPRSAKCANRAAARASQKSAYPKEIWAIRRWRLQLGNQGFRGGRGRRGAQLGSSVTCNVNAASASQLYANCHLTMQVV